MRAQAIALQRKGSWLITDGLAGGEKQAWQMTNVHGPLALDTTDREYFRVETACKEVLLVSRQVGERGMRQLRLDSFIRNENLLNNRGSFAS